VENLLQALTPTEYSWYVYRQKFYLDNQEAMLQL